MPRHYKWRHLYLHTPTEVLINLEDFGRERVVVFRVNEEGTLYDYIASYYRDHLPKARVVALFSQLCLGLKFLHDKGLAHHGLSAKRCHMKTKNHVRIGGLKRIRKATELTTSYDIP